MLQSGQTTGSVRNNSMYIYIYICMYVCIYVYIYMYICIYIQYNHFEHVCFLESYVIEQVSSRLLLSVP